MKSPILRPRYTPPPGHLTLDQVREKLGISESTIYRMLKRGTLQPVRSYRLRPLLFEASAVEALMQPKPAGLTPIAQAKRKAGR